MGFIEWVQRRLIAHGFDPKQPDGIWGRNTMGAVIEFQRARGLPAQGVLNAATVETLRAAPGHTEPRDATPVPQRDLIDRVPWMELALRKRGLHERHDNSELRTFLRSDGPTLGDPAELPWCGDFVETCVAVTLPSAGLPANPYLARNWMRFGDTVEPCFGAIMVFWRGSISGHSGHVGFYYSEDDTHFHVLGGNQSNSVNVAKLDRERFLGARMPAVGGPYPRRVVRSAADFQITENEF